MALRPQDIFFEDVRTHNISPYQEESLLHLFQIMVQSLDLSQIKEAHLQTNDFPLAKQLYLSEFELELTKGVGKYEEIWKGVFQRNNQWMQVLVYFEARKL